MGEADVDATNVKGQTSLHLACQTNLDDMVRLLLKGKASLEAVDAEQKTPLDICTESSSAKALRALDGLPPLEEPPVEEPTGESSNPPEAVLAADAEAAEKDAQATVD